MKISKLKAFFAFLAMFLACMPSVYGWDAAHGFAKKLDYVNSNQASPSVTRVDDGYMVCSSPLSNEVQCALYTQAQAYVSDLMVVTMSGSRTLVAAPFVIQIAPKLIAVVWVEYDSSAGTPYYLRGRILTNKCTAFASAFDIDNFSTFVAYDAVKAIDDNYFVVSYATSNTFIKVLMVNTAGKTPYSATWSANTDWYTFALSQRQMRMVAYPDKDLYYLFVNTVPAASIEVPSPVNGVFVKVFDSDLSPETDVYSPNYITPRSELVVSVSAVLLKNNDIAFSYIMKTLPADPYYKIITRVLRYDTDTLNDDTILVFETKYSRTINFFNDQFGNYNFDINQGLFLAADSETNRFAFLARYNNVKFPLQAYMFSYDSDTSYDLDVYEIDDKDTLQGARFTFLKNKYGVVVYPYSTTALYMRRWYMNPNEGEVNPYFRLPTYTTHADGDDYSQVTITTANYLFVAEIEPTSYLELGWDVNNNGNTPVGEYTNYIPDANGVVKVPINNIAVGQWAYLDYTVYDMDGHSNSDSLYVYRINTANDIDNNGNGPDVYYEDEDDSYDMCGVLSSDTPRFSVYKVDYSAVYFLDNDQLNGIIPLQMAGGNPYVYYDYQPLGKGLHTLKAYGKGASGETSTPVTLLSANVRILYSHDEANLCSAFIASPSLANMNSVAFKMFVEYPTGTPTSSLDTTTRTNIAKTLGKDVAQVGIYYVRCSGTIHQRKDFTRDPDDLVTTDWSDSISHMFMKFVYGVTRPSKTPMAADAVKFLCPDHSTWSIDGACYANHPEAEKCFGSVCVPAFVFGFSIYAVALVALATVVLSGASVVMIRKRHTAKTISTATEQDAIAASL